MLLADFYLPNMSSGSCSMRSYAFTSIVLSQQSKKEKENLDYPYLYVRLA
jgi:hypothetical protein